MLLKSDFWGKANAIFFNLLSHTNVVKKTILRIWRSHIFSRWKGGRAGGIWSDIERYLSRLKFPQQNQIAASGASVLFVRRLGGRVLQILL